MFSRSQCHIENEGVCKAGLDFLVPQSPAWTLVVV